MFRGKVVDEFDLLGKKLCYEIIVWFFYLIIFVKLWISLIFLLNNVVCVWLIIIYYVFWNYGKVLIILLLNMFSEGYKGLF